MTDIRSAMARPTQNRTEMLAGGALKAGLISAADFQSMTSGSVSQQDLRRANQAILAATASGSESNVMIATNLRDEIRESLGGRASPHSQLMAGSAPSSAQAPASPFTLQR